MLYFILRAGEKTTKKGMLTHPLFVLSKKAMSCPGNGIFAAEGGFEPRCRISCYERVKKRLNAKKARLCPGDGIFAAEGGFEPRSCISYCERVKKRLNAQKDQAPKQ